MLLNLQKVLKEHKPDGAEREDAGEHVGDAGAEGGRLLL
jgi:hypothetical protein